MEKKSKRFQFGRKDFRNLEVILTHIQQGTILFSNLQTGLQIRIKNFQTWGL